MLEHVLDDQPRRIPGCSRIEFGTYIALRNVRILIGEDLMKISEGVEWALHCCLALAWIRAEEPIPTSMLAAKFGLPPAYLSKCLQALAQSGILSSTTGSKGGFSLARDPRTISVYDVVQAIEGSDPAFRCTEIRQQGDGALPARECRRPCAIASTMLMAEEAWRQELSSRTLADVMAAAAPTARTQTINWYESATSRGRRSSMITARSKRPRVRPAAV